MFFVCLSIVFVCVLCFFLCIHLPLNYSSFKVFMNICYLHIKAYLSNMDMFRPAKLAFTLAKLPVPYLAPVIFILCMIIFAGGE